MNQRSERRFEVTRELARTLIDSQFREWAHLPLEKFDSAGTDHSIYRLGDELAVRFPVSGSAAEQVTKEQSWLPKMTGFAVATPKVIGAGQPANSFPFPWSVMNWIEGNDAATDIISNWEEAARDLGSFVREFRAHDTSGAPVAGKHNAFRGTALANLDEITRNAIEALGDMFEKAHLMSIWDKAMDVEP